MFTCSLPPRVTREVLALCCYSLFVQVGLFNTLGFVLHYVFVICDAPSSCRCKFESESIHTIQQSFLLFSITVGLFKRLGSSLRLFVRAFTRSAC